MIIQSSSQGAVQSTEVVSHHFSSFVLSRRAVHSPVHSVTHRAQTHGHVLSCRAARIERFIRRGSQEKLCQNAIAIYLGGALALLHNYNVRHCTAVPCTSGVCKALQCRENHFYKEVAVWLLARPPRSFCTCEQQSLD